jgi:hypothetical protein
MEALQRAIADACLADGAGEEIARDLRGFLVARGVAPEDVEAILAAPPRLHVYRTLVRNGLSSVVLRMLPRTRTRMNAACSGRFDADLASFVGQVGPRTHYLRDVPAEFFTWVEPRWRCDPGLPAYLPDLAALEIAHFAIAAAESARQASVDTVDVALDRPLAFIESARLARCAWAVHELSLDEMATDEPPPRDTCLLGYRDATHSVRWLHLTPLAAAVLERLLSGEALGTAVERACTDHGAEPPNVLADVARLLADLGERGVLIGGRQP